MGYPKKHFWFFLGVWFLVIIGCATSHKVQPGTVEVIKSKVDNSTHIHMEPAWLENTPIKLGLYRNSNMPENDIVLTVLVKGYHIFMWKESLKFNIDRNVEVFTSIDKLEGARTLEEIYGTDRYIFADQTSKLYLIDRSFLERIINANEVYVRVDLQLGFKGGVFSKDGPTLARTGFKKFLITISE